MKYTEKIHAERLLGILNKKDPCMCCPIFKHYNYEKNDMIAGVSTIGSCDICKRFVDSKKGCPCVYFGAKEAIKQTWLALEAKGYI